MLFNSILKVNSGGGWVAQLLQSWFGSVPDLRRLSPTYSAGSLLESLSSSLCPSPPHPCVYARSQIRKSFLKKNVNAGFTLMTCLEFMLENLIIGTFSCSELSNILNELIV